MVLDGDGGGLLFEAKAFDDTDAEEGADEGAAAVADEGKRESGRRQQSEIDTEVDEGLAKTIAYFEGILSEQ